MAGKSDYQKSYYQRNKEKLKARRKENYQKRKQSMDRKVVQLRKAEQTTQNLSTQLELFAQKSLVQPPKVEQIEQKSIVQSAQQSEITTKKSVQLSRFNDLEDKGIVQVPTTEQIEEIEQKPIVQPSQVDQTFDHSVKQPQVQPPLEEIEVPEATTAKQSIVEPIRQDLISAKISFSDLLDKAINYILSNPKRFTITCGVILFVLCNTVFLAYEQQKGFVNLGYGATIAWAIAILFEVAVEVLSISLALTKRWFSWLLLAVTLGFTVYIISGMVSSSAQDNVLSQLKKPTSLETAEQNLAALTAQQTATSEAIGNYDKKKQKNQIVYATAAMNKEGGLRDQITNARSVLATEQTKFESSDAYERALEQSETHSNARKIAVAWNIVLMIFLGTIFRE